MRRLQVFCLHNAEDALSRPEQGHFHVPLKSTDVLQHGNVGVDFCMCHFHVQFGLCKALLWLAQFAKTSIYTSFLYVNLNIK